MKYKLLIFLSAFVGLNVTAEEKVLDCSGTWEQEGMNLPPHAKEFVQKGISKVTQQYLVSDSSITIVGGTSDIKNDTFQLCKKSNAAYIYSWNCAVELPRLMAFDWTQEDDPLAHDSKFGRKWVGKSWSFIGAETIYLDRVNLSVIDSKYAFHLSTDDDKNGKPTLKAKNYVVIDHAKLQCRIAKPKL